MKENTYYKQRIASMLHDVEFKDQSLASKNEALMHMQLENDLYREL